MWVTLIVFWLFCLLLAGGALGRTAGHFGYPLDDTYIHMAIGKHFALDGTWGVTPGSFSSTTSSPLWTLLIGVGYRLFGVTEWLPGALGLISGSFTIILLFGLLKTVRINLRLAIFLVSIVMFTPLPVLALSGMEHTLHALLTIWLLFSAVPLIETGEFDRRQIGLLMVLAGLLTMTRYEGLFLVFAVGLVLFVFKRFVAAFLIGGAGLLPVVVYGLFSMWQGWYFLPNSILLKSGFGDASGHGWIGRLFHIPITLHVAPHMLILLLSCLGVYLWCEERKLVGRRERLLVALYVIITLLHLQFASIGWFYRYEAYLVLTGLVVLVELTNLLMSSSPAAGQGKQPVKSVAVALLGLLVLLPLAWRTGKAFVDYPLAVMNIYEQQYQMGLFVKQNYAGKTVAANDIGAISFLADVTVLDLFGLGSLDVAEAKLDGRFDQSMIDELVQHYNADIAVIYNSWFDGMIPGSWIEVGQWQILDNVICSSDTVSFYAPSLDHQPAITTQLQDFSTQLPAGVVQRGPYRNLSTTTR